MSSDNTPDWSLVEAARVLDVIITNLRSDLVESFKIQGWKILIYGPNENLCSIPETSSHLCVPSNSTGITVGNVIVVPFIKGQCQSNGFMTYSTLVHELAHALNAAFNQTDSTLQELLQTLYANAKQHGIWHYSNHYARKDVNEYFASLWEPFWFKNDRTCAIDYSMCSKDALLERDPWFIGIMARLLNTNPIKEIANFSCENICHPDSISRAMHLACPYEFVNNVVRLENAATKRLLSSDLFGLVSAQVAGNNIFQKWKVTRSFDRGQSSFEIRNVGSGLVLQANVYGRIYTSRHYQGNANQLWQISSDKTIINAGTNVLLASGGRGFVYAWPLRNAQHKEWNLRK